MSKHRSPLQHDHAVVILLCVIPGYLQRQRVARANIEAETGDYLFSYQIRKQFEIDIVAACSLSTWT
jgi:hypothetical protein